jgi:uridine kinase
MKIALPVYDRLTRLRADESENVLVGREDVVIIEGTVALQVAAALPYQPHRYFVESNEALRHARLIREYQLRGYSGAEAESIYASRQQDETPVIGATAALAYRRIMLPLAGAEQPAVSSV